MATRNDITGDRLVSRTGGAYRNNYDQIKESQEETNIFKIYQCVNCHIKVSTSNGKCPLCGNSLDK